MQAIRLFISQKHLPLLCSKSASTQARTIVPPEFTLLKIEGPNVNVASVETKELPRDWRTRLDVTRDLGTAWLKKNESTLLRVPSALVPETVNFLFNPSGAQAKKFNIADVFSYPFDLRLKT